MREGLDIPECALVAILDADKEGFLRSETSLIQTVGRAARNVDGRVLMYGDEITGSMDRAIQETERRRTKQLDFNETQGITPESVRKDISDILESVYEQDRAQVEVPRIPGVKGDLVGHNFSKHIEYLREKMFEAAANLEFEEASTYRDEIRRLEAVNLAVEEDPMARQADVDSAVAAKLPRGRSTAGKAGTRARKGKSKRR